MELNPERTAVSEWETAYGGSLIARGRDSSITGFGLEFLLVDDIVKNLEEASSHSMMDKIYDNFSSDIFTRLEGRGNVVIVMTRWALDDLVGKILESELGGNWDIINLPAIAEERDILGRPPGTPLWPERYDLEKLDEIREMLGERQFAALYQGSPKPMDSEFFKVDQISTIIRFPNGFGERAQIVIGVDKAATSSGGDYSSFCAMALYEGRFYILEIARGQWSTHEREQNLRKFVQKFVNQYSIARVKTVIEVEPGSGGKDSFTMTARNLAGFNVTGQRPTGSKEVRATPFSAQVEAGNVSLKHGDWTPKFLQELQDFPFSRHDDQVDSCSLAFNKLAKSRKSRIL